VNTGFWFGDLVEKIAYRT